MLGVETQIPLVQVRLSRRAMNLTGLFAAPVRQCLRIALVKERRQDAWIQGQAADLGRLKTLFVELVTTGEDRGQKQAARRAVQAIETALSRADEGA